MFIVCSIWTLAHSILCYMTHTQQHRNCVVTATAPCVCENKCILRLTGLSYGNFSIQKFTYRIRDFSTLSYNMKRHTQHTTTLYQLYCANQTKLTIYIYMLAVMLSGSIYRQSVSNANTRLSVTEQSIQDYIFSDLISCLFSECNDTNLIKLLFW